MSNVSGFAEHDLARETIRGLQRVFSEHSIRSDADLRGIYKAEILGPGWLRWLAKVSLPLAGLSGWYGKRLEDNGAVNLVYRAGAVSDSVAMNKSFQPSWLDGEPCLVLGYDQSAPALLRPMRDEFRALDQDTLLGLSIYNVPGLKSVPLPFLLRRVEG